MCCASSAHSAFARVEQTPIAFVKVHGALYHAAVRYEAYALAVVDAISEFDPALPVLCQPRTSFAAVVEDTGLRTIGVRAVGV